MTACLDAPPGGLPGDGGGPPVDADVAPLLLARYLFNLTDSLQDSSGNDHHARCIDGECPAIVVGQDEDDYAALFDGLDDLLTLDPVDEGPFTVMGRLRVDSDLAGALVCPINRPVGQDGANSWQICLQGANEGQVAVLFFTADEPRRLDGLVAMTIGNWYHVAIRWDGSLKTVWWQGDLIATGEGKTDFDESEIRFGSDLDGEATIAAFRGTLDDIEIWRGALTQEAIREASGS